MKFTIIFFSTLLLTFSSLAQNKKTITICKDERVFFDDFLDPPQIENDISSCTAIQRIIKPSGAVAEQGFDYFILQPDFTTNFKIISQRVPSGNGESCNSGEKVEQTVEVIVKSCEDKHPGDIQISGFLFFYPFLNNYIDERNCKDQGLFVYESSGENNLFPWEYFYVIQPNRALLFNSSGEYLCQDANKDFSCLELVGNPSEYIRWQCNGCTDAAACNYNPIAGDDDGSCIFKEDNCKNLCYPKFGCTDATARNYDPSADCDDGSCSFDTNTDLVFIQYPFLKDVVDEETCSNNSISVYQYNSRDYIVVQTETNEAVYYDNGDFVCVSRNNYSCRNSLNLTQEISRWTCPNQSSIEGCTDPSACNYNAKAVLDDETCLYSGNSCNSICYNISESFGCTDPQASNFAPFTSCDDDSCLYNESANIFSRYEWLENYVDASNCTNEKLSVYNNGSYTFVLIEQNNEIFTFYEDGTAVCGPSLNVNCLDNASSERLRLVESWACGGLTTYNKTIYDVLVSTNYHNSLTSALNLTGLDETLSGEGSFTVFAPTDEAFFTLTRNGVLENLLQQPYTELKELLLYHTLDVAAESQNLTDRQLTTALNGNDIIVNINNNGIFINDAKVTIADIITTNGVVHIIDAVLEPLKEAEILAVTAGPLFGEYPWLSEVVNISNCTNEKVTVYQPPSGPYKYLYIEGRNGATLYTEYNLPFCTDTEEYSCLQAYGLSSIVDTWSCSNDVVIPPIEEENESEEENETAEESEIPNELIKFDWLKEVVDFGDCASTAVEVYDLGAYSFVFVTSAGKTTMYYQDGSFYCSSSENYDCKTLYGLSSATSVWNCEGFNKTTENSISAELKTLALDRIDFQLYPNPTSGIVYIDLKTSLNTIQQIIFYDVRGRVVANHKISDSTTNNLQFNLSDQPKGLYIVKLIGENQNIIEKFMIE